MKKQSEDDKNLGPGTLGYLRGLAKWLVYLARGVDEFGVTVCSGLLGRDLFDGLKRAGDRARASLMAVKFPVPMSNRIAYGLAGGLFGGRNVHALQEFSFSAADFPDFPPTTQTSQAS